MGERGGKGHDAASRGLVDGGPIAGSVTVTVTVTDAKTTHWQARRSRSDQRQPSWMILRSQMARIKIMFVLSQRYHHKC